MPNIGYQTQILQRMQDPNSESSPMGAMRALGQSVGNAWQGYERGTDDQDLVKFFTEGDVTPERMQQFMIAHPRMPQQDVYVKTSIITRQKKAQAAKDLFAELQSAKKMGQPLDESFLKITMGKYRKILPHQEIMQMISGMQQQGINALKEKQLYGEDKRTTEYGKEMEEISKGKPVDVLTPRMSIGGNKLQPVPEIGTPTTPSSMLGERLKENLDLEPVVSGKRLSGRTTTDYTPSEIARKLLKYVKPEQAHDLMTAINAKKVDPYVQTIINDADKFTKSSMTRALNYITLGGSAVEAAALRDPIPKEVKLMKGPGGVMIPEVAGAVAGQTPDVHSPERFEQEKKLKELGRVGETERPTESDKLYKDYLEQYSKDEKVGKYKGKDTRPFTRYEFTNWMATNKVEGAASAKSDAKVEGTKKTLQMLTDQAFPTPEDYKKAVKSGKMDANVAADNLKRRWPKRFE